DYYCMTWHNNGWVF
nr:immunoglobulin light chain junction region [Macaca mulatta]MOY09635.1 immunoglobulin light chain junction region [Macaca mulatta]